MKCHTTHASNSEDAQSETTRCFIMQNVIQQDKIFKAIATTGHYLAV